MRTEDTQTHVGKHNTCPASVQQRAGNTFKTHRHTRVNTIPALPLYSSVQVIPSKSSRFVSDKTIGGGSWLTGSPTSVQYFVSRARSSSSTGRTSGLIQRSRARAQATCSGVWPRRLRKLGDAPATTSWRTMDGWSATTATCRAVWPCCLSRISSRCDELRLWADAIRYCAALSSPLAMARWSFLQFHHVEFSKMSSN